MSRKAKTSVTLNERLHGWSFLGYQLKHFESEGEKGNVVNLSAGDRTIETSVW